jgi:polysaccharide biosynthesis protein PslG
MTNEQMTNGRWQKKWVVSPLSVAELIYRRERRARRDFLGFLCDLSGLCGAKRLSFPKLSTCNFQFRSVDHLPLACRPSPTVFRHRFVIWILLIWILLIGLLPGCQVTSSAPSVRLGFHTLVPDDRTLRLAGEAGATVIIQVFPWRELEPTRRQYHWELTDELVAAAEYYGLDLVARLDQTPAWLESDGSGLNAPPIATGEYRTFAATVAHRYRGRIAAYVLWNEPNLAVEWGQQPPSPAGYVALLRAGYEGVKAGDPGALVVSAGLAPTNNDDLTALDDRRFLQQMYDAGAAAYFDVLGAHPYGFGLAPDAARQANGGLVFARVQDWRELMVANGDVDKPIWITEVGWSVGPPQVGLGDLVSETDQAQYLLAAFERVNQEWPWVQVFGVWNLAQTAPDDPFGGFSLLDPGGRPRPAYNLLTARLGRRRFQPPPPQATVQIVGPDVKIHLGDSDLPSPWWPLYGGVKPSIRWTSSFYLADPPPPGTESTLVFEIMQSNELNNTISINSHPLTRRLPQTDFTRTWVTLRRAVAAEWLRAGHNTISIEVARLAPDLQHADFEWDDIQIRNIRWIRP